MAAGGLVSFSGTMVTLTALDACNVSSLCNVTELSVPLYTVTQASQRRPVALLSH